MCGIISIICNNDKVDVYKIILNGLKQLQNRGYDSAGIGIINDNEIKILKYASKDDLDSIDNIEMNINKIKKNNIIIGHTRWATHGEKNDINSHPHLSYNNLFSIVHNGIIENFYELKVFLEKKNIYSKSETDSEIIVNLLGYFYDKFNDIDKSLKSTISLLEGTYALIIQSILFEKELICIRKGSPLLIGKNKDYIIICSEQSGFQNLINNYILLENNDICIVDSNLNIRTTTKYKYLVVNNNQFDLTFEPYSCWLEKEIYEQYDSSKRAISYKGRLFDNYIKLGGLDQNKDILKNIENIILLGCGTSYNAGYLCKMYFQDLCHFNNIQIINASEFNSKDIPLKGDTAIFFLSQSGETKDLYNCIEIADEKNCFKIGIINCVDSFISKQMDCGCYLNAGREVSIASTKSYINQLIVLNLVSLWFSQLHKLNFYKRLHYIKNLHQVSDLINITLGICNNNNILFDNLKDKRNNVFILGKGKYYALARECSLKIKEICYIQAEAYESSELKHGPYSLLDENSICILFITKEYHYDKLISTYEQLKSRKCKIIIISNIEKNNFINCITIPYLKYLQEILFILPIQLSCLKISQYKKINPDKLKNLAKCVTTD